MREEIICAGFGGQGIMLLGKVLAQAALEENKKTTWMPSYGAAMRGGCAYCMVVISDEEIASPYIDKTDTLFVFNQPSWDRFKERVKKGGLALVNSSLIKRGSLPDKIDARNIPFTEIATSLGDARVANMVALGAYLKNKNILKLESVLSVFRQIAPKDKQHLIEINQKALEEGTRHG